MNVKWFVLWCRLFRLKIALWFFSNSQERLGNVTKSGQQISPSSIKLFFIRPNTIFTMWLWIIFRIRYEISPILWDYCQKCTAQDEESLGEKHHWWIADFNVQSNLFSRPSFYNAILFFVPADIPSPSCFDLSMKARTRFAPPRWLWLRGQLHVDWIICLGIDAIGGHNWK